jgi:hypothetical protein
LSGPEFHAEWLRDEPYDATATDPRSYIPDAGATSLLETGNMGFGKRDVLAFRRLFSFSWKKRP